MNLSIFPHSKKPLTLAVMLILLTACNSTPPRPTPQQTKTITQTPAPIIATKPVIPQATTQAVIIPTTNVTALPNIQPIDESILDEETLRILEDLLEARDVSMVEGDRLTVERYGNLWDRVRQGYKIRQPAQNYRIEAQKNWFASRQAYLDRLTARASRYLHHTVSEAERRGIPTELALLPIIESSYDPSATSNASAAGLWQFIPSTGRIYGLNQTSTYDGRRDVIESTRAAYDFLTSLYNQFGSWELALAAYNAGPGRVQRAINMNLAQNLPTDYWSLSLPTETMNYVPRFMAVAQIISNPAQHGVNIPAIANHTHFRAVPVNYGTSLYDISSITGVPVDELQLLNPALTDMRVDNSGPNRIIIPNSLPTHIDHQLQTIGGITATAPMQNTSYIAPIIPVVAKPTYTQELKQSNTLPTTTATLTENKTILQEPPLSKEEIDFIAEQIRLSTPVNENINPINDGKIKLDAVQTNQSVLDARGQKKSLSYAPTPINTNPVNQTAKNQSQPAIKPKVEPKGGQSIYVVKRGDTLTSIANRHGVSVADLAQWNQLNANAHLLTNTRLKLYNANPASTTQTNPNNQTPDSYTVQAGDTLTGVAAKHNLSVAQLANYNNLSTDSQLQRGQRLWLVANTNKTTPPSKNSPHNAKPNQIIYTVSAGDTLTSIANEFGITTNDIAQINDFNANSKLVVGQNINIPISKSASTASSKNDDGKQAKNTGQNISNTQNYKVKSGDTLTSIANRHGVSLADLAKTNNLSTSAILQVNQTIKVPRSTITYIVKSGDTLIGIANEFGITTNDIAQINDFNANSKLVVGQNINIPISKSASTASTASSKNDDGKQAKNTGQNISNTQNYKVKSGDTLTSIANRHGVSLADLAKTNNLSTSAILQVNQTIKVPKLTTTHTVKSGDTLIRLAKTYGIDIDELVKMNNIKKSDPLQLGQTLIVPNQ